MKIRQFKLILLILLLSFPFIRCEEKLDEFGPLGNLDAATFYNTETDFEAASLAPYSTLLNLYYDQNGRGWFQVMLFPSDDVRNNRGNNDREQFNWLPTDGEISYLWDEVYKGIMRANVVLDRLPEADGFNNPDNKARFEAEAKFMRAYFNFILARTFGNPPIVKELVQDVSSTNIPSSEPGEIWNFIIEDLEFAKNNLPGSWSGNNVGRATSWAAKAFLGKVYLYRAQWDNNNSFYDQAISELSDVVDNGPFMLVDDFGNNFRIATENNAESVFEIQFSRGDFNPWLSTDNSSQIGAATTGRKIFTAASCDEGECAPGANSRGYGQVHVTQPLQEEFEPNDPRRPLSIFLDGDIYSDQGEPFSSSWSITGSTPAKYIKPFENSGFPNNVFTNNERIIRYSDVLLMLAEAQLLGPGNVSRAAELINMVRERARNNWELYSEDPRPDNLLPDVPSDLSVDEMFDALMHERRVELAMEVHRYDDLVRWHRGGLINIPTDIDFGNTLANQNWEEKHLLRPIPQGELDLNSNLDQNEGYE